MEDRIVSVAGNDREENRFPNALRLEPLGVLDIGGNHIGGGARFENRRPLVVGDHSAIG
jgi:hypothetical protein